MTLTPTSATTVTDAVSDTRGRLIEFDGARNFRDIGGYRSQLGGEVRWGRVYRAAALHEMTAADRDRLESLGIVTVYDLRSRLEFEDHPDPVPSINVPILGRYMAENEPPDFASFVDHDQGVAFMTQMVRNMLDHGAVEIGQVIGGLAHAERLPAVFHCTAGKDRTGLVAALLLEVLGVEREVVLDDFQLTDRYRGAPEASIGFRRMLEFGMPPEAAAGAFGAPREMMSAALDSLDAEYGGAERYLVEQAGLPLGSIERLRSVLLA